MKNRNWFLPSLLLLIVAALLLRQGEQRRQRELSGDTTNDAPAQPSLWERFTRLPAVLTGRKPAAAPTKAAAEPSTAHITSLGDDRQYPFRVRNTDKKDAELFRSETAVLLRNALVETLEPATMNIPAHLRAQGDPGSYLVQARGAIDDKFRAVLRGVGAEIVSYVPNNTFLVRASANDAQQLRVSARVQSVLPFEPFYKLDMTLLPLAVRREAMPAGRWLNLVLFSGTQTAAIEQLRALGAEVKSEQRFPFGHVVTVAPAANSLVALAQMPAVQNIEAYHSPILMNDLSRVRLDVSTNTTDTAAAGNWLSLTGLGVTVGVVDGGVDLAHAQLAGRMFANAVSATTDVDGHGTFVAGVIAATDSTAPTPTNGSLAGGTYRGIAPGALIFPLSLFDRDYTNYGNVWLITNSALATNTLTIVNHSWGYPVSTYDIPSAQMDEAVRDSLPFRPHDQPITHVFAAGNSGGANSGGTGGAADTIASPGNGKNVITVGASELLRFVPNSTNSTPSPTNDPIATAHSDSLNQVADFSSRGNVGVGIEGTAGRFKPDMVAPGAYIVSLRASTFTNLQETDTQNMLGSSQWRYDSGSSFAAAKVSGLLALMQEFFGVNFAHTNKPALNKALLINRAQSLGPAYDFAVNNPVTHQGWGIPSLSNTVPSAAAATIAFLTNTSASPLTAKIVIVDESSFITNHLASGQYHAFDVTVAAGFSSKDTMKITLAWTDPAGNPISSAKLVNDLDLYVFTTNTVTSITNQFEGNNFAPGTTFTQPTPEGSTSQRDSVNNVENVFITGIDPTNTIYRVYVIGRKVNVNAVSGNSTNGTVPNVVQDYALVISTDDPTRTVSVTVPPAGNPFFAYTNRLVNTVTNGLPYLNERVGANPALFSNNGTANANTNGVTNQWNFYVFTNQNTAATATNMVTNIVSGVTNIITNVVQLPITTGGTNVILSTFLPPNLARSRMKEADVDMYVTRSKFSASYPAPSFEGGITNLFELAGALVISNPNTLRSTNRGGYELITFSDSFLGEVFYVGIKSEDQQGGQYGFLAAATQLPFSTNSTNGNIVLTLFPVPVDIPDGSPDAPGGVMLFGIGTTNVLLRSADIALTYVHENFGDLVGTLTHNGTVITLNNHTISPTAAPAPGGMVTNTLLYDDFRNPPDGPGDVTDLIGQDGIGLWIFEVYDNAPFQTGRVDAAAIYMVPFTNAYSTNRGVFYRTITLQAGQSFVDFLDIPTYATNLDVDIIGGLAGVAGPAPQGQGVDLLAGVPGRIPTSLQYDIGTLDIDNLDVLLPHLRISSVASGNLTNGLAAPGGTPSLTPGRWNFRILNNTAGQLTLTIRYTEGLDLSVSTTELTFTNALVSLLDNYTTNVFITAPQDRVIASIDVGVAIQHPRISDLVIHLVGPSGTKVLLFEDRYGTNGLSVSNLYANFTENTNNTTHIDTNGYAPLGFLDLGYLLPMKFVPAPFSAVVSPPRLFTNATNLTFGYRDNIGSVKESPGGLAQLGNSLFMAGMANRNGTNDAFIVSYETPILTNTYTSNLITSTATTNLVYLQVTNWAVTNFWTGPFSGYRGVGVGGTVPEQTFFNGVAVTPSGVAAVGQTRNWFPPVLHSWSGTNSTQTYDVDLGCTSGTIQFTFAGAAANRMVIEYQGLSLMDTNGTAAYTTNIAFSGASRFLRITANPTPVAVGSTWANTLTVLRNGGVSYAVSDFVSGTVRLPPVATPVLPNALAQPRGVALDSTGNVYVADSGNDRILRFGQALTIPNPLAPPAVSDTNGTFFPLSSGTPLITGLNSPGGVAVNSTNGDIFVADTLNNQIKRYSNNGALLYTWGAAAMTAGSEDSGVGGFADGRFNGPQGITLSNNTVVLVADTGNNSIRQIVGTTVTTLTTPVLVAPLSGPRALTVAGTNIYVADTANNRVVSVNGLGSLLAGSGVASSVDGVGVLATFSAPSGITRDGYGNFYVADAGSHRVRRVTPLGLVQTIAGSGAGNGNNDVGTSAQFNTPRGLAADSFGAVFVAEGSGNNSVRLISPYQTHTPTNSFVAIFPFNGPTNAQPIGTSAVVVARGIANSVFGLEHSGADSRESFSGVASSAENGTNFFYAVVNAQFSTNSTATATGLTNTFDRMALTKFGTNGQPVWTRGHMAVASIGVVTNGGPGLTRDITSFVIGSGGAGYTAPPVAALHDPLNLNPALRNIPLTLTVAGGAVTGVSAPATPIAGPFVSPRVYVEAPQTPNMPGNGLAVAYGTNVIAAGFTNLSAVPLTTNNAPFLMCLETTNGTPRWALASTNGSGSFTLGHYSSVAVYGDKLIAVGAAYSAGVGSVCLLEQWSLLGGTQLTTLSTNIGIAGSTNFLTSVVAIESLDRAYAVGSQINANKTWDAIMVEIDLTTLAVVSVVVNNITNFTLGGPSTNIGKAITTDGVDLYVAVEGPGENQRSDRQAAVFRYRAKNFYLPEESLNAFVGERTWATNTLYTAADPTGTNVTNNAWRLQVADTRAGGTNGTAQVVSWNLNFSYAATNINALTVATGVSNPIVLLSAATKYFRVPVPSAAGTATNLITATGPVRVTFHPASLPLPGAPGTKEMFSGASTGSFLVSTNTNAVARLRPGSDYYLGIQALNPAGPVNVSLNVNFDQTSLPPVIPALADGTPLNSFIPRTTALNQFKFTVPANATAATFELLNANGDVNLYLLRSNSPTASPSVAQFDFRSANPGTGTEQIFVATNGTASSLTPGIWFLGVQNADNSPVNFTVRATSRTGTPYTVVTAADAQGYAATTTPGNAPNSMFKLPVPAGQKALLFEVRNLTGAGDLVVRRGTYPVAGAVDAMGTRGGALPEVLVIRTNGALPSLTGDWYFGVVNPGSANVSYTVMARQPTNGVLLSGNPIQLVRSAGATSLLRGTNFGFDLDVVPGEKYQVQYRTNLATGSWLVLTNITASSDGLVSFLHSGALSNKNLYYRIQVVP